LHLDSNGSGKVGRYVAPVCGADTPKLGDQRSLHRHQQDVCQWTMCSPASGRRGANSAGDDGVLLLPITHLLYHRFGPAQPTAADRMVTSKRWP